MSLTIQQLILDAKRLASRLKDSDTSTEVVLTQAQSVYKQIDAMKQYQEEVSELNDAARQRPHTVLVAGIQQENRHLRELQQENRELRAALEEHQNALELIMSKYRQQVSQLIANSKLDLSNSHNDKYSELLGKQSDKISEMAAVMSHAANLDEKKSLENAELMARLKTENKGLREMLDISMKYGSKGSSLTETGIVEDEPNESKGEPAEKLKPESIKPHVS